MVQVRKEQAEVVEMKVEVVGVVGGAPPDSFQYVPSVRIGHGGSI